MADPPREEELDLARMVQNLTATPASQFATLHKLPSSTSASSSRPSNTLRPTAAAFEFTPVKVGGLIKAGVYNLPSDAQECVNSQNAPPRLKSHRTPQSSSKRNVSLHSPLSGYGTDYSPTARGLLTISTITQALAPVYVEPVWLNDAIRFNRLPEMTRASLDMPFVDPLNDVEVPVRGVIRVLDPPYYVTRHEVLSILGRNAKVSKQPAGSPYNAVHILMERETGKTQDVFVEVETLNEANQIVAQFARRLQQGNRITLGQGTATVVMSSQQELMESLFPRARKVHWEQAIAIVDHSVDYYYEGQAALGFDGFLGDEETSLLCKWLGEPARSPFAQKCRQRPYECAITLLHKYPIDNSDKILMGDRERLFSIADTATASLCETLRSSECPMNLRSELLQELAIAAFTQRSFSDQQKAKLFGNLRRFGYEGMAAPSGMSLSITATHEFADRWPFLVMQRLPTASDKHMRFYANLIREFSRKMPSFELSNGEREALALVQSGMAYNEPFVAVRVSYGASSKAQYRRLTWRQCMIAEQRYINSVLQAKLPDTGSLQ